MHGDGYPALTKFIKGNPMEALVVFIPGAGHTARISYGGHENSRSEDFLSHWLVDQGYNFLGISYPIETRNPIFSEAYPHFNIRSWGKQAAEIAKHIIEENGLTKRIIFIVWSNGGRITQSFNESAMNLGLEVNFCAAFSSTPPNMAVVKSPPVRFSPISMAPSGYEDRTRSFQEWFHQISCNAYQNHEIIPKEIYYNDYVGNMPINIQGSGYRYENGSFVPDNGEFTEDSKNYDFANFPLIATIVTDNVVDGRHALTDYSLWGYYLINKICSSYIENNKIDLTKLPPENWKALLELVNSAPRQLTASTKGNHFFFVGESGARKSARDIKYLELKVNSFKATLGKLIGVTDKLE
ncbi:hypothetical protein GCM10023310_44680 [Paenibacillus vulneris]